MTRRVARLDSGGILKMSRSKTVLRLRAAFDDCGRVLDDLTDDDAISRIGGGSAFAWTHAHLANSVDAWINVRFQGLPPHPLIGQDDYRFGGSGTALDWTSIQAAVQDVQVSACRYLDPLDESDLDHVIPYDGSIVALHAHGLCLRDAVEINIIHHYFHIGEIAAKRGLLGHPLGNLPTAFWEQPDWFEPESSSQSSPVQP